MRKIGIFSGSFDPVHAGHIAFANEAAKACGLETVVFMPERFPRGKPSVSPISERLTELEIALVNTSFTAVGTQSDQFTVSETLPELNALYPDAIFTFLIGSDVALNLPNWQNIQRLVTSHNFAVGMRNNDSETDVKAAMANIRARYTLVMTPYAHISSRALR